MCAYNEVRRLLPLEDIIYLADKKNAPYGTKSKEELIELTKKDIKRLCELGADTILIACCTASTVHSCLDGREREISLPIITPAAEVASGFNSVMVIATKYTAESGAFSKAVSKLSETCVLEFAEQRLVSLVEGGCRDGLINAECKSEIDRICCTAKELKAEALVLGCTHFTHLEEEFRRRLSGVRIISPAKEGAGALVKRIKAGPSTERGRITYTENEGLSLR